jgi:hypothetical protein
MIVAHHLGENLVPTLLAAGATTAPALLVMLRAKLGRLGSAHRRDRPGVGR